MKKMISRMMAGLGVVVLVGVLSAASPAVAENANHKPVTQKLIALMAANPEIKTMLETSIAKAKALNPDLITNPAQSLGEYTDFIDSALELIPQEVLSNPSSLVREQILQSICYFYFLIDQPLDSLEGKGLYRNTIQYYEPFSVWLRDFANAWGQFLDTEESWNQTTYEEFYTDPRFGLAKGWYESPSNWRTFNEFFSKYLKSLAERPLASPEDLSVVASPADSVPQGIWMIDADSNISVEDGLKVKLATYYNVGDLLSEDSEYKDVFANGVLTHAFLNVNDYHRYHFAVGGTVKEKNVIQQNLALEVSWSSEKGIYVPLDSTGWQFSQTRGYVIVDTGEYGLVALIPMGMAQVSSVNFEEDVTVGSVHKKGDMLGTFLFGGSDFVMLFQSSAGFEITAATTHEILIKSGSGHGNKILTYKHLLARSKYGEMKGI